MAGNIGITPPEAFHRRERLFRALEYALEVRFEPRDDACWTDLDGLICFGVPAEAYCPRLVLARDALVGGGGQPITFTTDASVDNRLRGQTLSESVDLVQSIEAAPGDLVLARCSGEPVWLRRGRTWISTTAPGELGPTETVRDHFTAGRFLGLLPVLAFVREITRESAWQTPSLRAAIIFDDPNLHAASYGFLHFPTLVEHAHRNAYHVVLATIPLDLGYAQSAVVRLLKQNSDCISLAIHGNNHEHNELERTTSYMQAAALAAEALRRTQKFEARTGLRVSRVMCPPHEACSAAMRTALFELGYEAMTTAHPPRPERDAGSDTRVIGEWEPAQFVSGGLPSLARHSFGRSLDDVVLRAYLDQPLLLFGHHHEVASGLDRLAEAARCINRLGTVHWLPLAEIARTNFATQVQGKTLRVRLYTRRARIPVAPGIEQVALELPAAASAHGDVLLGADGLQHTLQRSSSRLSTIIVSRPESSELEVEVLATHQLDPRAVAAPAWRIWPVLRRGLTEGRDRVAPLRSRAPLVRAVR